tara:strand:- start:4 stop:126 length:123 start_codon:yes stop_codon:yes gene_type:complete
VKPSEVLEGRTNERTAPAGKEDKDSRQKQKIRQKIATAKF